MEVYCSAPWQGITIREDGAVKTCCSGRTVLGNLADQKITDILKSEKLLKIRKNLLDGREDPNCGFCRENEKIGNTTLRQHYQRNLPFENDEFKLKFIDVRWNNHCNLSCIYCGPHFSSEWAKIKNIPITSSKKSYQDELLDWLLEKVDDVDEINIVGGEPLLMKQNHRLIEKLPADAQLGIITNLSYDLENLSCLPALMARPKNKTLWNISVENIGLQYEYVRRGAQWNQFLKNLDFLIEHWGDSVLLLMVYGIFSATKLHETIEFFHSRGIKNFLLQSVKNNDHLDTLRMPSSLKHSCIDSLEKTQTLVDSKHIQVIGLDQILFQLKNYDLPRLEWNDIESKIKYLDDIGPSLKFQDLWPDVIESLQTDHKGQS